MEKEFPILYSFRHCPHAIRARWALLSSNVKMEIRKVILKYEPNEFLKISNSGTVPCLQSRANIIDESIDIMIWALRKNDPDGWLDMPDKGYGLIDVVEKKLKLHLHQTKYASGYTKIDSEINKRLAIDYLINFDKKIKGQYLFGNQPKLSDVAIFPFVRQFAHFDINWFNEFQWKKLKDWLDFFLRSKMFIKSQKKFDQWTPAFDLVFFS